jgi:hypothetical protein
MTASKNPAVSGLDPLKDLLGDVLSRLEALESKVGLTSSSSSSNVPPKSPVAPPKVPAYGTCLSLLLHFEYRKYGWMDGFMQLAGIPIMSHSVLYHRVLISLSQ